MSSTAICSEEVEPKGADGLLNFGDISHLNRQIRTAMSDITRHRRHCIK